MKNRRRLYFITALLVIIIGFVVWKLVSVQILQHERWKTEANTIHERKVIVQPERGRIYDRNGELLAFNKKAYSVAVDSYDMTKPELLIDLLVEELKMSRRKLNDLVYRQSYFTWIDREVSYETGERIKSRADNLGIEGLIVIDSTKRVYPREELAGHIVGFTGVDGEGLAGVEYSLNDTLEGEPRAKRIIYGANRYPYREITLVEGRPGSDVYLTIDLKIQHILKQELKEGVERFQAKNAWGVVIDPSTGEVLAMSQNETYDPNNYNEYEPSERKNLGVSQTYEPGSILKVFSGLAALDGGTVTPDTPVNGNSPVVLYNHPVNNAQYRDYGVVPFSEVIKNSINTGIIRVSQQLGEKKLWSFLNRAGFGKKTGIELPGEESGKLRYYAEWSGLAIGSIPIGQGMTVTGIQLASKLGSIANGGVVVRPTIVDRLITQGEDGEETTPGRSSSGGLIASRSSVSAMKDMLRQVVEDGTGTQADIPGYAVSGKTGTAQKAEGGRYLDDKYISSFAGFFPHENPEYLILIVIDEVGTLPVWGGATAGEVFNEVGTRIITAVEGG
ncbi:penicillin-binding protein 2 [Candidatus Bipolaricaulota bacterium]|nr:penicillin-binding protein 2 [Candidatus Bipolaricaulota bacterium]